jgi:tetratricopeptide (TPR) repeat protein
MAYFGEADALWRAFGNLPMLADTLIGICFVSGYAGEYESAIASFEEALTIGEETGSAWTLAGCRHNIGFVLSDRGEVERALREMEEGIRLSEQVGFLSPPITIRCDMARLYRSLGAVEQALKLARLALEVAESRLPALRIYALAVLVHLALAQGDIVEAEVLVEQLRTDPNRNGLGIYQVLIPLGETELALAQRQFERASELAGEALAAARQTGARAFVPSALDLQARAWLGRQRPDLAGESWREAARTAEALGARRRLWPILAALSRLADDQSEADALRMQAREVAASIAEQMPPELRITFRSQPVVQALFEGHRRAAP